MDFLPVNIINSNIIYKQINEEDFDGYEVTKEIITPTSEGYILDQIKSQIDFQSVNTVVINAGVGQGKTHTIMQLAKQYYDAGFVLVFAVPYKSLIDQYEKELNGLGIISENILDYRKIDSNNQINNISPENASQYNIHLLTVNSLIGNPGDEFILQSRSKVKYLNLTIERIRREGKKVIFIFDEIHDSIHNFQQQYIFTLWKWKGVIQKIFIVSATYNEASKIVIKYIAELTDNKIQILESKRLKIELKQSDLFLILYQKPRYNVNDEDFKSVFQYLLNHDKKIQILSYSRSLIEKILTSDIGESLKTKYAEENINICTGETENKFNIDKCNIGTTFSTGINIKGTQIAFVIILPNKIDYSLRKIGIYSRGINTLIQAIARLRDKSEIYIITTSPDYLINYSSSEGNYINKVKELKDFQSSPLNNDYRDLNQQRGIINETYEIIRNNIEEEIELINSLKVQRQNKPSLEFPSLDDFILTYGEKVLATTYDIFGKDLSVYTFWAAFNDQFLNCRLKGITPLNALHFNTGRILQSAKEYIENQFFQYYEEYAYHPLYGGLYNYELISLPDIDCYKIFRGFIFSKKVLLDNCEIKEWTKSSFERKIILLTQILKKNRVGYLDFPVSDIGWELVDCEYEDYEYLLACFSHALNIDDSTINDITDDEKALVIAYKGLAIFLTRIFDSRFISISDNGVYYFKPKITNANLLSEVEISSLKDMIDVIKNKDTLVNRKIISFFQKEMSPRPLEFINNLYRIFRLKFFKTRELRVIINGQSKRRQVIAEKYEIPEADKVINFLYKEPNTTN